MKLTFLGAAGTVTGSKTLLTAGASQVLVDCGLFQGGRELRLRNWSPLPLDPHALDAVVLTHAHVDHSGWLPLLVAQGFTGPVHATEATRELCAILLPDSGRLQEEEARDANARQWSRHHPARPLYTEEQARAALERFRPLAHGERTGVAPGVTCLARPAGHILGSAIVELEAAGGRVVFSGDLGRPDDPLLVPPGRVEEADWLVLESTYGDRTHPRGDVAQDLAAIVRRTIARGGTVLVPSFAVGRTQLVLHHLNELRRTSAIPGVPIVVDSPMAAEASDLLCEFEGEVRLEDRQCRLATGAATYARTVEESRAVVRSDEPCVILSASGMAEGGRVLHHLRDLAPDPRNAIVFVGYQAEGTRGAEMVAGAQSVRIHGEWVNVQAEVEVLHGLSAHADQDEILGWLSRFTRPPRRTFLVHGEPRAAEALKARMERELGWDVAIPAWKDEVELG